jgi:CheY-like chemotaxis protein
VLKNSAKTILVIDDNEDARDLLGGALRGDGYCVCEAENGRDALDQLEAMSQPPSLLLLDMMMPVMSGPELLQALHEHPRLASVPVVILSAGIRPSQAPDVKVFMGKPTDLRMLRTVVRELCGDP